MTSRRRESRWLCGFNLPIARNYYNFDRQIRVIPSLPDGSIESFAYDHKGRLIKQTSFEGVITVYTYDEFDRVSSKTFFENQAKYFTNTIGETWTYEYDQFGRVTKINQNGRETITEYDTQGRTISVTTPEGKISYTYDAFGRQTSVQTDNDSPTVYSYDNFGRLQSVTSDNKTTTYEYDAFGNLARTKLPNGVVTTYEYDNMNRLIKETNFADKNNNGVFDNGEGVSQFDYTLDAQGRKTNAIEKFWADLDNDGVIDELFNTVKWGYDNAGRLVYEEFDHYEDAFDQTQVWEYDLVSNRTLQKLDKGNDGIFDEITKYNYDINDRLLEELFDGQNDGIFEKLTLYDYDHTQQTGKTVSENGVKTSETTYKYDLQGRMSVVTITTYDVEENITRVERTSYDYGADGIRTSALHEIDANGDGTFETSKLTEYLNDPLNITGYSQVLKQTETNNETGEITITTYVIGHQRISQTVEKNGESSEYYFTFDGHGSTRVLTDIAGVVVQLYAYDAFGNAIAFNPSTALTEFLYSGEQFDAKIGQQYLRQRYYDPSTGRFNRLDPFFGNTSDPLSLHKYTYVHGDPINMTDPSGLFGLGGVAISIGIQAGIRGIQGAAVGAVTGAIFGGAFGGLDAWAGGNDVWTGMAHGAKTGALFGLAFGAYLGAGPLLLSGEALMTIKIALMGYTATSTFCGVTTSENSLQGGIRLTAGLLMIWGILAMPTVPVKIEVFGGQKGQFKDHINIDIIAERGIQADLTQLLPLPNNVSQAIANNPYLPSGNIMNWLPNVAGVLKPGGKLIVNGQRSNKFAKIPNEAQLQQCGLRIVEIMETLAPEYQNLTFTRADGGLINPNTMRTIILEKK